MKIGDKSNIAAYKPVVKKDPQMEKGQSDMVTLGGNDVDQVGNRGSQSDEEAISKAKNLIKLNFPVEAISQDTGLSIGEIGKLKSERQEFESLRQKKDDSLRESELKIMKKCVASFAVSGAIAAGVAVACGAGAIVAIGAGVATASLITQIIYGD